MSSRKQQYNTLPTNDEEGQSDITPNPSLGHSSWFGQGRWKRNTVIALLGLLSLTLLFTVGLNFFLPSYKSHHGWHSRPLHPGISYEAQKAGLEKCKAIKAPRVENIPSEDRVNPRGIGTQPVLLKNAVVWDGEGNVLDNVDILVKEGVIHKVKPDIKVDQGVKVIDVKGHIVSPGLVDMHTHLGVDSWPELKATDDTNEMTSPVTPFVKSIDGFNPSDLAIRIVASGGVTSALVLPGSGNLIGGEAFVFKLRDVNTTSNEDMLVQAHIDETKERRWRYEKHACGENAKRVYGNQGKIPSTRLGEGYLFRKAYSDAKKLLEQQDDWCFAAERTHARLETRFPENLELEALVAILRGDVKLNVHCYETHDLEAFIRHSLEFNFTVAAFHHALDAYRVPDILKRAPNNITIATFADHWGYKKEAFQASPHAPRILLDAGIPVALKSDHPVLNSQHLVFEAAKAHHYGLSEQEAFQTVTSVPAKTIGLGHRIGSLKVGYDADLVIWDRSPLEIGASPLQVFIDGVPIFDEKAIPTIVKQQQQQKSNEKDAEKEKHPITVDDQLLSKTSPSSFIITNIGRNLLSETKDDSVLVVKDGKIICSGQCAQTLTNDITEINIHGGYVVPGFVAVGSGLGLVEIPSESTTSDGVVSDSTSRDPSTIVQAVDGIKFGTRHLEEAYKGGVLSSITAPFSNNVISGISVGFKTGAESILNEGSIISPAVALHASIGHSAKSTSFPTVSSQIAFLRQIFLENESKDNYYGQATRGEIPTIISVDQKDEIATLIKLKEQIPTLRLAILGGAESHLVAQHLAKADIPVILSPSLCTPSSYDTLNCLSGAPLTNGTVAHELHRHGVKIGLGVSDDGLARNLVWDAGWIAATSPENEISEDDAIDFVSTNLQDIFFGQHYNKVDVNNDFTVWSGNPFDMKSRIVFVHSKENGIQMV
ncbi:hypothetical protein BJ944DRAFT_238927 [Cunninghamella echinulata]|nr:hypothetical protein BJ944DRAFT_238927 [Cunninghamella echinulata]